MSVVTFWNDKKEQTGKTLSAVAVATYMTIEHNYKILVISTGFNDKTLDNCFWKEKKAKKNVVAQKAASTVNVPFFKSTQGHPSL